MIQNSKIGDGTSVYHGAVLDNCSIGQDVEIWRYANLYECTINDECVIGPWTEIQSTVEIGERTTVSSHTHVSAKTTIGSDCFIGHGVRFVNNPYPPGEFEDWKEISVGNNVVIGSNACIFPVKIGDGATVGAGAVVLDNVEPGETVVGNPAKPIEKLNAPD